MVKDRVLFTWSQEQDMDVHNHHCYSTLCCQTINKEVRIKEDVDQEEESFCSLTTCSYISKIWWNLQ